MTAAQFKEQGGCPGGADEKPVIMYKDGDKAKFVSFLDPSKHPSELCAPCCFFANHADAAGRLAGRVRRCGGAPEDAEPGPGPGGGGGGSPPGGPPPPAEVGGGAP
jgi:hypothetical protein